MADTRRELILSRIKTNLDAITGATVYRSRVEHEFRYSDNIRVLLEIIVTIGQIRRGP